MVSPKFFSPYEQFVVGIEFVNVSSVNFVDVVYVLEWKN